MADFQNCQMCIENIRHTIIVVKNLTGTGEFLDKSGVTMSLLNAANGSRSL